LNAINSITDGLFSGLYSDDWFLRDNSNDDSCEHCDENTKYRRRTNAQQIIETKINRQYELHFGQLLGKNY